MIIALQTLIFFRESVMTVLDQWLPPLFKQLFLTFSRSRLLIEDDVSEEQVYADYDTEHGVVFHPPIYSQRYAAVCDCLMDDRWCGKLEKVVNMGRHYDMAFIKYLTEVPGVKAILGVDIESSLDCSSDLLDFTLENYRRKRDKPLMVTLLHGNVADPDYRLIGCDAVVAIEMIEYLLPHDLDRLVHNIFGFVKPWIAIFTTPNADFNILFKSLAKNGCRRLDQYFEWTRMQLHDWCSNIVARYPEYTVSCRGVGPGPPGTSHFGCCTQLVLFMSKNYQKQMELNVNSLALVANLPKPNQIGDYASGWESPTIEGCNNVLCALPDVESHSEFEYPEYFSCNGTLSPTYSATRTVMYLDKASQCNVDIESGKSFVMFNVEEMYEVVMPRRRDSCRVYEIENVANRLNNTMFEVKKFSKTTQNLMANNKMDSLVCTREVMDEISHLTKILNFNSNCLTQGEGNIWCNINWGENAPYWNQYYKVMAVYNYPYEVKDENGLILDLITDEIIKFLDAQYEASSFHVSKLEIPIERLMGAVEHITKDTDRILDLLEYNGYEVVDSMVVYSRIVVDDGMTSDDDWPDNDTYSDWDTTDVNSTISEGSNAALDYNARCLRRALDRKVRKLRAMFTHDEDITRELNQVVCRLMKIALSSSRGRQAPVQSKWLQCKLLDLLTLTEKAILRRKMRFVERYPLKALGYETQDDTASEMIELCRIKEDDTAMKIFERYRHLVQVSDNSVDVNRYYEDIDLDDDTTSPSNGHDQMIGYVDEHNASNFEHVNGSNLQELSLHQNEDHNYPKTTIMPLVKYVDRPVINRTQHWVNEDVNIDPYTEEINACMISSGDDHSCTKGHLKYYKKHRKYTKHDKKIMNIDKLRTHKGSVSNKKKPTKKSKRQIIKKDKFSKTKYRGSNAKKPLSSYKNLVKKLSHKGTELDFMNNSECSYKSNFVGKPAEDLNEQIIMQLTASKPIPDSIIELCHPELCTQKILQEFNYSLNEGSTDIARDKQPVAATKDSIFIQIVTDEKEETISMRRTVGTDADVDPEMYDQEFELSNLTSVINDNASYENLITAENVHSQIIFLNDINEPSTSKGLRHVSMDVQCGTDAMLSNYAMLSATTSLATMPKVFATGIKIGDSISDVRADKTSDFGTSTYDNYKNSAPLSLDMKSVGIRIKDSASLIRNSVNEIRTDEKSDYTTDKNDNCSTSPSINADKITVSESAPQTIEKTNCFTMFQVGNKDCTEKFIVESANTTPETLNRVSGCTKMKESNSELNEDKFGKLDDAHLTAVSVTQEGNILRITMPRCPIAKFMRPILSCGGVHVHSYMDRQISEDVLYQGEWQRYRPKSQIRKKITYNSTAIKKKKESVVKKANVPPINNIETKSNKIAITEKARVASIQVRNTKLTKTKEEIDKKMAHSNKPPNSVRDTKNERMKRLAFKSSRVTNEQVTKGTKVASKLAMSNLPQNKNSKTKVQLVRRTKSVPPDLKQENKKDQNKLRKSYIPPYLNKMPKRIKVQKVHKSDLDTKTNDLQSVMKVNKDNILTMPFQSKAEEIKTELLKVIEPRNNVSYVVFRNEIDNSKSRTALGETAVTARPSNKSNINKRSLSPASQNSSSCSSPNSVATVRAVPRWPTPWSSKRHSTPNNKKNVSRKSSDQKMTSRIKRFIKKNVTPKKESGKEELDKDVSNKENVPESSNDSNLLTKDTEKVVSGDLFGTSNSIYTKQFLTDNTPNKSSIKIPFVDSTDSKNRPGVSDENKDNCTIQNSNMVVVLESCQPDSNAQVLSNTSNSQDELLIIDNTILSEWIASPNRSVVERHTSNILAAMKQLVEESLDFVETPDNFLNIDSETVILSRNGSNNTSLNDISISPVASFKTVIDFDPYTLNGPCGNEEQKAIINGSAASDARSMLSAEDPDLLSFKSVQSISRLSDCFADNESYEFNPVSKNNSAVRGIYERKETILTQNPGALAIEAFSGFSMNAESVAGDQSDYVNLIDSETGSVACEITRLATSEELFVSGRSSESYASCLPEEDAVVPNWLFQIISQQQSGSLTRERLLPREIPLPELEQPLQFPDDPYPNLDENSNEISLAAGAGAGDGRGIHSDQSQDSSGRGSSLSSSATSSGVQSEAIIIDPTGFIAQFEMLREAATASGAVTPDLPQDHVSVRTALDVPSTTRSPNGDRSTRPAQQVLQAVSDVEADISSTDTDVPSDN